MLPRRPFLASLGPALLLAALSTAPALAEERAMATASGVALAGRDAVA